MRKNICRIFLYGTSFGIGFFLGGKMLVSMINDYKWKMKRNLSNMMLFNDWLHFIYIGGSFEEYLLAQSYKNIMIYGNGYIGKRFLEALSKTDIEVVAIMDKQINSLNTNEKMIGIESNIPNVDCIVVTPVYYYDEIYDMLKKRTGIPIISIQDILEKAALDTAES